MTYSLLHRSAAFCLAAVITLAMLGSVDQLFQHEPTPASWAARHTTPTPRA